MASAVVWQPYGFLNESVDQKFVVIKLNTPFRCQNGVKLFERLWEKAVLRACTDGAANVLYDCVNSARLSILPDIVSGDFDSARPEVLQHFRDKGVRIVETPDQNETDFTKCLRIVAEKINADQLKISEIFVHVSNDDRIDHTMANINTLYKGCKIVSAPIYLFLEYSVCFLLPKGKHVIHVPPSVRGDWCSLVPIGEPCQRVTTSGLKYNLCDSSMKFGDLISTSNSFQDADSVTVETDTPLLWSSSLKF